MAIPDKLCEMWLRPSDNVLCFRYHGALDISTEYPSHRLGNRPHPLPRNLAAEHFRALNTMTECHQLDARLAHTMLAYWLLDGASVETEGDNNLIALDPARAGDFGVKPIDDSPLYYVVMSDKHGQLAVEVDEGVKHAVALRRFPHHYLKRQVVWLGKRL